MSQAKSLSIYMYWNSNSHVYLVILWQKGIINLFIRILNLVEINSPLLSSFSQTERIYWSTTIHQPLDSVKKMKNTVVEMVLSSMGKLITCNKQNIGKIYIL